MKWTFVFDTHADVDSHQIDLFESVTLPHWPKVHYAAQAGLKFVTAPFASASQVLDFRHEPPHLVNQAALKGNFIV